ncbi:MAG: hypothetical protein A3E02_01895 [Candidatus Zambryskibacteria bacterium RIFCSPHIGHO2_12_FULL_38_34]|uniref:Uncharacterized protein n=1 Tax=Candidatus Zambryskibacteria bacterium RIFCSPLOWO2_12_FULL_39_16 TaxID=1802775 RepID=A0A1G2URP9_9BACT|nr:MAG: hypothetical protein A3E02_01895 [Candidatus Zambryskibacteria bacterium RIFCSPHIGHO2_12_FULL_38_34]OHB08002.1 MAG: hypothetical protein A3I19_00415 [Candidatus Zambryskibacteria bacterium RIFCSPLOWO2_02_FULL_38_13]OHB12066.1 MAG: hypothetical protein A3G46_02725 [Candidatus Zambryskibacteria bacterium RIFCSPLOWO2_12_FULL_39_16]
MDTFNPNQMPPINTGLNKKPLGPLVAVIIILSLIIIGGLYFLKERASQKVYPPTTSDSMTKSLNQQSSSDDLNSIEADLNATDVNNLDQGAAAIEAQLQ